MESVITLRSFAKINIGLRILSKRSDGYHNLETVFYEVEPHDTLKFAESTSLSLLTNNPAVPSDETNLCFKAAKLLQQKTGCKRGASIVLEKSIPMGAGLGGGSSNAAATLVGLNKLWNLQLSNDELLSVAIELGSDVPFFLLGGCAYATGRGEQLQRCNLKVPYWILVVTPPIHVSTAWAYQSLKVELPQAPTDYHLRLQDAIRKPEELCSLVINDFEKTVMLQYPDIGTLKNQLLENGALFTLLSGSGSSVFAFFKAEEEALQFVKTLPSSYFYALTSPKTER